MEEFSEEKIKNRVFSGSKSIEELEKSFPKEIKITLEKTKYILLEKTKSLHVLVVPFLNNFPANAKFTLREKIENTILECIRLLILGNYSSNDDSRKEYLRTYLAEMHLVSILIYQSMLLKYLAYQQYILIHSLIKELFAMGSERYKRLGGKIEENF